MTNIITLLHPTVFAPSGTDSRVLARLIARAEEREQGEALRPDDKGRPSDVRHLPSAA